MGDVSEASLLEYIYFCGGRVRNSDLLKTYKQFISHSDLQLRAQEFCSPSWLNCHFLWVSCCCGCCVHNCPPPCLSPVRKRKGFSALSSLFAPSNRFNFPPSFPPKLRSTAVKQPIRAHQFIHEFTIEAKYREEFKLIIDRIAVCKSENGEKYLILKKKYRQLMQERECEPGAKAETEVKCNISPHTELRSSGLEEPPSPRLMEKRKQAQVSWCGPTITVAEAQEQEHIEDEKVTDILPSLSVPVKNPEPPQEDHPEPTDGEDELDKDSGSKSESEQDEDCTGSVGSAAVALDPIEKEWIYSAASGRLAYLTQLLKQDASLANKKFTALHWAAKHGKEDMAVAMANAGADVNTKAGYTPLHIAALHGHQHIVDLLITTYGAKENLRDYSGHLASHYLKIQKTERSSELTPEYHSPAQMNERRNRKLASLFHSRKKWGSAEELAPVPEERTAPQQLMLPAFRPRKFSR